MKKGNSSKAIIISSILLFVIIVIVLNVRGRVYSSGYTTPEEAFGSYVKNKYEIVKVYDYGDIAYGIARNDSEIIDRSMYKKNGVWYISQTWHNVKSEGLGIISYNDYTSGRIISIAKYIQNEKSFIVEDSLQSEFCLDILSRKDVLNETNLSLHMYSLYLDEIPEDYELYIDGQTVEVK